jgi:hypothetical protein
VGDLARTWIVPWGAQGLGLELGDAPAVGGAAVVGLADGGHEAAEAAGLLLVVLEVPQEAAVARVPPIDAHDVVPCGLRGVAGLEPREDAVVDDGIASPPDGRGVHLEGRQREELDLVDPVGEERRDQRGDRQRRPRPPTRNGTRHRLLVGGDAAVLVARERGGAAGRDARVDTRADDPHAGSQRTGAASQPSGNASARRR